MAQACVWSCPPQCCHTFWHLAHNCLNNQHITAITAPCKAFMLSGSGCADSIADLLDTPTHTHTHTHPRTHTCIHMHTHTNTHTHAYAHTHTHIHTHKYRCECLWWALPPPLTLWRPSTTEHASSCALPLMEPGEYWSPTLRHSEERRSVRINCVLSHNVAFHHSVRS